MASLIEIAELVGASAPAIAPEILRVSGIEAATPVALVFASDAPTLHAALNSPAGAILTKASLLAQAENASAGSRAGVGARAVQSIDPTDPRLLPVADPRFAFALAARFPTIARRGCHGRIHFRLSIPPCVGRWGTVGEGNCHWPARCAGRRSDVG